MPQNNNCTVKAAAERLHLTPRAVLHRIQAGTIAAEKIGEGRTSAYLIPFEEVERLVAEQEKAVASASKSRAVF